MVEVPYTLNEIESDERTHKIEIHLFLCTYCVDRLVDTGRMVRCVLLLRRRLELVYKLKTIILYSYS